MKGVLLFFHVLGFAAWNVYGTSYGSYLAQTLMRDHPEGIRSVVLDSVLPTTYTIPGNWRNTRDGFDNLFHACAAETACNAAHPHLEETFTRLVNKLEAAPLTTTVSDPATGKDVKVVLDGQDKIAESIVEAEFDRAPKMLPCAACELALDPYDADVSAAPMSGRC